MSDFPTHEWAGDEYGHACAKCSPHGDWYCDKTAHNIGMTYLAHKLLKAIEELDEELEEV